MDFLLSKATGHQKSVSSSLCCFMYNSFCKFIVEELSDSAEKKVTHLGESLGCKIPDITTRNKLYTTIEEKEKFLLFSVNELWKFIAHKSVQVIERSNNSPNECNVFFDDRYNTGWH